jgi:hypothetical protein
VTGTVKYRSYCLTPAPGLVHLKNIPDFIKTASMAEGGVVRHNACASHHLVKETTMNSVIRTRRPPSMAAATVLVLVALILFLTPLGMAKDKNQGRWVGTWSASPQAADAPIQINGQTVRQVVHTSVGGEAVRIRLSNAYGVTPLVVGSAHVALSAGGASIFGQTDRVLTFNGSRGIAIPAGAVVVSDSVALALPPLSDLAISLYLPDNVAATTEHRLGLQTTSISGSGDFTRATDFAATPAYSFFFLSGVEVSASREARAVVTLGDSVTDGAGSTQRGCSRVQAHRRWLCSTPA